MSMQSKDATALREIGAIKILPIGVPVDLVRERERWMAAFATIMLARKTCEMTADQLLATVENMIGASMDPEDIVEPYDAGVLFLEGALELMRSARSRLIVGMARACEPA